MTARRWGLRADSDADRLVTHEQRHRVGFLDRSFGRWLTSHLGVVYGVDLNEDSHRVKMILSILYGDE